jgi:dipeptidyl aminopeptidase/acylaminoacyl peptidase
MADKLRDAGKTVEYIEFPDLDHQLDDAAARTKYCP